MGNYFKHFKTITSHKHKVFIHCCKAGIPLRGLLHDLSKYTFQEFIPGVKYYQGFRSPNEAEREAIGYSSAWIHHKGVNKHHYEHWTDYDPVSKEIRPVPMPQKYVIEMFCDRVAASKTYLKEKYTEAAPLDYYTKGRVHRFLHPETAAALECLLNMLAEKGEDETFRYIRESRKKKL